MDVNGLYFVSFCVSANQQYYNIHQRQLLSMLIPRVYPLYLLSLPDQNA